MHLRKEIIIVDYGMGNLYSIKNALKKLCNHKIKISSNKDYIKNSNGIIIPGVGSFKKAMQNIEDIGILETLNEEALIKKKPILSICLGMQLLFDNSSEGGFHKGLGWIPGKVEFIKTKKQLQIPHVGWNDISFEQNTPLFNNLDNEKSFYFVHSYEVKCRKKFITATVDYGKPMVAAVQKDNIFGVQFHPEKSHENGFCLLKNFVEYLNNA